MKKVKKLYEDEWLRQNSIFHYVSREKEIILSTKMRIIHQSTLYIYMRSWDVCLASTYRSTRWQRVESMSHVQKLRNRTRQLVSLSSIFPRWFKPGAMLINSEQENQSKAFGLLRVMMNETTGFRSLAYTSRLIKKDVRWQ